MKPGGRFAAERRFRLRRVNAVQPNLVANLLRVRDPDRVAVRDAADDADNLALGRRRGRTAQPHAALAQRSGKFGFVLRDVPLGGIAVAEAAVEC